MSFRGMYEFLCPDRFFHARLPSEAAAIIDYLSLGVLPLFSSRFVQSVFISSLQDENTRMSGEAIIRSP